MISRTVIQTIAFQSTPPARGATNKASNQIFDKIISIHAPREGGDIGRILILVRVVISIHAPREGGDIAGRKIETGAKDFNPRPPRGGRRLRLRDFCSFVVISIHAPREGGDRTKPTHTPTK